MPKPTLISRAVILKPVTMLYVIWCVIFHLNRSNLQTSLHSPLPAKCPWCFPWTEPGDYSATGEDQLNPLHIHRICQRRRWVIFLTDQQADSTHMGVWLLDLIQGWVGKEKSRIALVPAAHSHARWGVSWKHILRLRFHSWQLCCCHAEQPHTFCSRCSLPALHSLVAFLGCWFMQMCREQVEEII